MSRMMRWIAAAVALAACAPPAGTAATAPPTAALSTATRLASATPTRALASSPTTAWTPTALLASPTPAPIPTVEVRCPAGEPWSGTQNGLVLYLCADPRPPALGSSAVIEVFLTDTAGVPVSEAEVTLTLIGGMAGMEGEHDEDFTVDLEAGEAGRYAAAMTVGSPDLMLTGLVISVRHQTATVTFSIAPDELLSGTP
jgi:hypothetical protein